MTQQLSRKPIHTGPPFKGQIIMLPSYTQIYAAIYSAEHRAGRTSYNRTQEEMPFDSPITFPYKHYKKKKNQTQRADENPYFLKLLCQCNTPMKTVVMTVFIGVLH